MTADPEKIQGRNHQARLVWGIGAAIVCRVLLNTARRFIYPFAPALSRGLGVPLTAITSLIAINQATAMVGIFFGPLSDRIGYRFMMLCALGMLAVGMLGAGFLPVYGMVLVALLLAGLGKCIFDPAIQAFVGERVPYRRRGTAVGFLETSWAGSSLVGIPVMAFLIHRVGWRAPFLALGVLALMGIVALWILLPKDKPAVARKLEFKGFFEAWRPLFRNRAALGALGFSFFFNAANDNFFVVYGAWLERSFDLSLVALGAGTAVIGLAELFGEGLTASFSDRLGLRQSVVIGGAVTVINYALIPFYSTSLTMAFTGIFLLFLTFEFTIVTYIALCTELLPRSRATLISSLLAAAGIGRVGGALLGGPVWLAGGITATAAVSALISILAVVSLMVGLRGLKLNR